LLTSMAARDAAAYGASGASVSQSYAFNAGTYTIYGRAMDKDGGFNDYQTTITVSDATPTITVTKSAGVTSAAEGMSGQTVAFTYTIHNTSTGTDPLTVTSLLDSSLGELLTAPITLAPGATA